MMRTATEKSRTGLGPRRVWATALGLVLILALLAACGERPSASSTAESALTTAAPSQPSMNDSVGQALLAFWFKAAGEIALSDAAASFVPPQTFPVYAMDFGDQLTQEAMDAIATKLGMGAAREHPPMEVRDNRWRLMFMSQDPNYFLLEDTLFDQQMSDRISAGEQIQPPSGEKARAAADKYLSSLGYADSLQFEETTSHASLATSADGKSSRDYPTATVVKYRVTLDGVPLVGREAAVTVTIGPNGAIVGFDHQVHAGKRVGVVKLRPVAEAVADLKAGLTEDPSQAWTEVGDLSQVTIDSVEVVEYRAYPASPERYYKPVYVFHSQALEGTKSDWLVSAFDAAGGNGVPPDPPAGQRAKLDALDAPALITLYLTTTDPAVIFYLSAPTLKSDILAPNRYPEKRHEGDVANLTLKGPANISLDPHEYPPAEWPIQEQFVATYDLTAERDPSMPPGPQVSFVYVGREKPDSPWKLLGVGSGP